MNYSTKNNFLVARLTKPAIHVIISGLATFLFAPAAWSAALTIADQPLFLSTAITPNVFFELDDSGSMDWEILTVKHWHFCDYDRNAPNDNWDQIGDACTSSRQDDGLWSTITSGSNLGTFRYIFVNSDGAYTQGCDEGFGSTLYSCDTNLATNAPYQNDWRIFSSKFNVLYYNPDEEYEPWKGPCLADGSNCTAASFTAAKSDPREGKDGYTNTTDLDGFTYEFWVDTAGYSGSQPERGDDINYVATPNDEADLWDAHSRYTIIGDTVIVAATKYTPSSSGLNPVTITTTLSGSSCHIALGGPSGCRTIAELKDNVANWYQYARKRSFVAKAGISAVLDVKPEFRYGLDTINESSAFVEVPATLGNNLAHNNSLLAALYDTVWPGSSTPLRQGLERAGEYYNGNLSGKANPILDSCQKNYTVLMTDGYWNQNDPAVGNADSDGYSNTVADVAKYYHNIDLDTSLDNDVPEDSNDSCGIRCDTENRQHMVTYTLAFGVKGNLADTNGNGWPNPLLAEGDNWGDPYIADSPDKIDDLWHAAWNSYGKYINVSTPGEAVDGLKASIADVDDRQGSASSVALNSGFISADTRVYQALFNGADWSGDVKSIPILAGGIPDPDQANTISASEQLPSYSNRIMLTNNGMIGVAFRWGSLSDSQKVALDPNAIIAPSSLGNDRLKYLRGDTSMEGTFRVRNNGVLSDIVNSSPAFSGAPAARYPNIWSGVSAPENCTGCEKYSTFKFDKRSRTPMLYVGTNGGYLSGFDADTMEEKIAYVPGTVFKNLSALSDPNYTHQYYVDGSPAVVDAFFQSDDKWHSVLVSGLNKGGQGIFALDITDPSAFSETGTAPADTVLWEFTDADDADLGYTYSRPAIVRMQNGQWAAVFGNGYNNTDNDGNSNTDPATAGNAYLYIVDIEDGSLIRKIDTGVGSIGTPNGLATPAVIDSNGDFIADAVYAGDLLGNLWKFDISSSDPTLWDVAFYNEDSPPVAEPLYVAKDSSGTRQPIMIRPDVGRGPNGINIMVYFGTGSYVGSPDLIDTSSQTFYGILDNGSMFTGRDTLGAELIEQTVTFQNSSVRVTSKNPRTTTSRGWFIDLPDSGERVVAEPILRIDRIIFVTTIPDSNICSAGGDSWLMELNSLTGSRLDVTPFDLNNDGLFTLEDYVDTDGDGIKDTLVSGIKFDELIPTPGILPDAVKEYKYTSDSSGNLDVTVENPGPRNIGRQSWGQLR